MDGSLHTLYYKYFKKLLVHEHDDEMVNPVW